MAFDPVQEIPGFPVNSIGELIFKKGIGDTNVVGTLPVGQIPVDTITGKIAAVFDGVDGGPPSPRGNRLATAGDSLTAFGGLGVPATATAVGNVITVNVPSGHGCVVGSLFIYHLSANDTAYNGVWKVASVIDANNLTYISTVAPTNTSSGANNSFVAQRSMTGQCWWNWANMMLGNAFRLVVNAGVGSNTSTQLLARLEKDVIAYKPDYCTVLIGTNDIRYAAAGPDAANAALVARDLAFVNIKAICTKLLAAGITPILCTILPIGSGDGGFAISTPLILTLNDSLRNYALQTKGIILADTFAELVDNAATDNRAMAAALLDTVHLNTYGGFIVGRPVAEAVRKYAPIVKPLIGSNSDTTTYNANSSNRLNNPLFIRSGGTALAGVTGVIAENWRGSVTGSATAVGSLVPRTLAADGDKFGNNQRFVVTSTANGETATLRTIQSITNFDANDEVFADFALKISAPANVQYVFVNVTWTVGGVTYNNSINAGSSATFPTSEMPFSGIARSLEWKLPVAPTDCVINITAAFTGAGGVTIEVGRARIGKTITL